MTPETHIEVCKALEMRARGGNVEAAKLLFSETAKRIRPIQFEDCNSVEELQTRFGAYMSQENLTAAESDAASKAFDRLFKTIVTRDKIAKEHAASTARASGLMLVPMMGVDIWEAAAIKSQTQLKQIARE